MPLIAAGLSPPPMRRLRRIRRACNTSAERSVMGWLRVLASCCAAAPHSCQVRPCLPAPAHRLTGRNARQQRGRCVAPALVVAGCRHDPKDAQHSRRCPEDARGEARHAGEVMHPRSFDFGFVSRHVLKLPLSLSLSPTCRAALCGYKAADHCFCSDCATVSSSGENAAGRVSALAAMSMGRVIRADPQMHTSRQPRSPRPSPPTASPRQSGPSGRWRRARPRLSRIPSQPST